MSTPFYRNVPAWIVRYMANAKCSKCEHPVKKNNITAIGVRGQEEHNVPYIEYQCEKCNHRAMKSFGGHIKGTIEEICYMLLEESQNKNRIRQSKSNEGPRKLSGEMTDDEVSKFLSNMEKCETFMDLLNEIGASPWIEDKEPEQS